MKRVYSIKEAAQEVINKVTNNSSYSVEIKVSPNVDIKINGKNSAEYEINDRILFSFSYNGLTYQAVEGMVISDYGILSDEGYFEEYLSKDEFLEQANEFINSLK